MTDSRDDCPRDSQASPSDEAHGEAETIELSALSGGLRAKIGPYRLVKQIGEGGMGVVYLAEQEEPVRRSVALKIVRPDIDSDRVIARFEAERNALALMDHPHIAQVLDAGLADPNRPYFVMELVLGLPITELCDKQRMGVRERAQLLVTVCRAVQHAHQKGIIHRDIKPSNVIVCDSESGPLPKVIDFGVAKAVNAHDLQEIDITLDGHAVGTPLYMSPEQARLANSDIDTRSDVYSLGVLFYELLTGTTPILSSRLREMDLHDLRRVIRKEEPPLPSARLRENGNQLVKVAQDRGTDPRSLIQSVRGDLDQIVSKAMAKDRNERYPTANGLARDIERHLDHLPIEATAPSAWYRFKRFARRHVASFATISLVAVILLLASLVSTWQAYQKHAALASARAATARLSELLYLSDMKVASHAWKDADSPRVAGLLERHIPLREETDHRHFEWYYLSAQVGVQGVEIETAKDDIETIRVSPDGTRLAVAGRDGKIRIYDATSFARLLIIDAGYGNINDVAFTSDGQRLISGGDEGTLNVWDLGTAKRLRDPIPAHDEVRALVFAGEGDLLVSCGLDKRICLWDVNEGNCEDELQGHTDGVESLAVSPGGWLLVSTGNDATMRLWDLKRRQPLRSPIRHSGGRLVCAAFSHDGKTVAAGDVYGNLIVYDVPTDRSKLMVRQLDGIESIVFLPGDRWLAAGDRGGSIQLWPVASDEEPEYEHGQETFPRWRAYDTRVTALALSPDGEHLLTGSRDGQIRRWSAQPAACRWSLGGAHLPMNDFACVGQLGQLAVAGTKGIQLWDLDKRTRLATWAENEGPWVVAAASPTRNVLVTGDAQGQLIAWQLDTQTELARWEFADSAGWDQIEFAPDGRRFAAAAWDRLEEAWIFDLDAPGQRWQVPARQSKCVGFHPDGKRLAVAWMDDGRLYEWQTQEQLHSFRGHSNTLSDLAFSPDGATLATVGHDRKLRLWDLATSQELYAIVAHRDWVRSVAFAPDGWSLATSGDDKVVRIWHAKTGQLLMELPNEGHSILKVQLTPDGRKVVCRTKDHRIVIYDSERRQESP